MNAPYLLVPIGLVLLVTYSMSLLFSRFNLISKVLHRKIWNYGLLLTFGSAAVLGLLMVVQINYRVDVPWTEVVLRWHVNLGIAMSFIGIFHFIWHWKYYFPRRKGQPTIPVEQGTSTPKNVWEASASRRLTKISPFLIGFTGIMFQTFLIRELLSLFQGNELMISIIMFLWLLLTGAGAHIGIRASVGASQAVGNNQRRSIWLIICLFILPLLLVPLLYYGKCVFFAPGIEAGPIAFSGFLLLVLFPFCLMNGFSFSYTVKLLQPFGLSVRQAYLYESFGSAVAGIVCTLAVLAGVFTPPASRFIEKLFHPNDEIVATISGATGRLTITRSAGQTNIFENGILTHATGNPLVCEEMAHFAMVQHPDPRCVLVIGGLLSGVQEELLKYSCDRIDLVEPNPQVFRMSHKLGLLPSATLPLRYISESVPKWIQHPDHAYDVVLVMLSGPQNLALNRFYTADFFKKVKNILTADGVLSVMLPGTANYLSPGAIQAIHPVINAVRQSFHNALLFPGENNYIIAKDSAIRTDILEQLTTRKIPALYISEGYFDENQMKVRIAEINAAMPSGIPVNTDLRPKAYLGQIAWWLGHFPDKVLWPLAIMLIALIVIGLATKQTAYTSIFLLGAGASGLEIIALFLLQITAGSLYLFTGLLLAFFMGGLALGSAGFQFIRVKKFRWSTAAILVLFTSLTLIFGLIAMWVTQSSGHIWIKCMVIMILTGAIALLSGLFFTHLTVICSASGMESQLYVYDLIGAALGSLVYPMVIIPLLGLLQAIGLISISAVLVLFLLKYR